MSSAINNLSSYYLQQVFASALQKRGSSDSTTAITSPPQSDSAQLSPFAQLVSALQQLQQSNPTEYAQVTQQIATDLQNAAQTAEAQGNTGAANQLGQLATDFTNASQTGQLPDLQDLAAAIGSGGGHHSHHHAEGSRTSTSGTSSSSNSSSADSTIGTPSQELSQLISSLFQTNDSQSTQNSPLNAGAIILQNLSSAGINVASS
jgi:hypothetical protein